MYLFLTYLMYDSFYSFSRLMRISKGNFLTLIAAFASSTMSTWQQMVVKCPKYISSAGFLTTGTISLSDCHVVNICNVTLSFHLFELSVLPTTRWRTRPRRHTSTRNCRVCLISKQPALKIWSPSWVRRPLRKKRRILTSNLSCHLSIFDENVRAPEGATYLFAV